MVIHSEASNKLKARTYSNSDNLRLGEVNNVLLYAKFKGEDEFLNKEFRGNEIRNVLNNMYNNSDVSVNSYYDMLTLNKLNLNTCFVGGSADATESIQLDHQREYYMPYSDNNKLGYFEYVVVDKTQQNKFIANMYFSDTVVDNDPSDGVVTQHYLNTNPNAIYGNHIDAVYREMKLIYEIGEKANAAGVANVNIDENGDGAIDAATILLGVTPDNEIASQIEWADMLWPHQTSVPYDINSDEAELYKYVYNIDLSFLSEGESEVNGSAIDKYNLFTSDFLLDETYEIDSNLGYIGDVGTVCHELAHTLGLPDLYSYTNQDIICVGKWDLMDVTGAIPQFVNGYMRNVAGWLEDNQVPCIDKDGDYELKAVCNVENGDVAGYIIKVPGNDNQFFFIEYRKDEGLFDGSTVKYDGREIKNVYESGIVIYRIDTTVENTRGDILAGNYQAPPYNIYTFRDADMQSPNDILLSAINGEDEKSYGSIDANNLKNALTLQDENGDANINSRVVIDNVSIDNNTNKIKFTVDAKDPSVVNTEISDNKVIVSLDEKIVKGADYSNIKLLKGVEAQDITVTILEDNKLEITLNSGELKGAYKLSIPKAAINDVVGKTMANDFEKVITGSSEPEVIAVETVELDKSSAELNVGQELQLNATVKPENATNKNVSWTTSHKEVATVDDNGKVVAVAAGETTITVTTEDGAKTASCNVTVKANEEEPTPEIVAVTGVELDKTSATIKVGDKLKLNATVKPENATNKNVSWETSNKEVATVDAEGNILAISEGEAIITVKAEAGEFMALCNIKVEKKVDDSTVVTPGTTTPGTTTPGKGKLPETGKESPLVAVGLITLLGGVLLTLKSKRN